MNEKETLSLNQHERDAFFRTHSFHSSNFYDAFKKTIKDYSIDIFDNTIKHMLPGPSITDGIPKNEIYGHAFAIEYGILGQTAKSETSDRFQDQHCDTGLLYHALDSMILGYLREHSMFKGMYKHSNFINDTAKKIIHDDTITGDHGEILLNIYRKSLTDLGIAFNELMCFVNSGKFDPL